MKERRRQPQDPAHEHPARRARQRRGRPGAPDRCRNVQCWCPNRVASDAGSGFRNAQQGQGQRDGEDDVEHEGRDRRRRADGGEHAADQGPEGQPSGNGNHRRERAASGVLLGVQLTDRHGRRRHHEPGGDAVDDLAREEPSDVLRRGERDRTDRSDRHASDQGGASADAVGDPAERQHGGDQRRDVDAEEQCHGRRAEVVTLRVDREQRRREVAGGQHEYLRRHHQPKARAPRPGATVRGGPSRPTDG